MNVKLSPGKTHPLGATWDGKGTNFALFSQNATEVELCLFDKKERETRLPLVEVENYVWHGYVKGVKPGQKYGFRVSGPYEPPYAKAIAGDVVYGQELFNYSLISGGKRTAGLLGLQNSRLFCSLFGLQC